MADYHIYIHGKGGSGSAKGNFKPSTNKEDSELSNFSMSTSSVKNFIQNGASSSINSGISQVAKVIPAVAIGVAIVKTADSVLTTGFDHLASFEGNYQYSMNFNNVKSVIADGLNPFGTIYKSLIKQKEINIYEKKVAQERELVGASRFNKKVGV